MSRRSSRRASTPSAAPPRPTWPLTSPSRRPPSTSLSRPPRADDPRWRSWWRSTRAHCTASSRRSSRARIAARRRRRPPTTPSWSRTSVRTQTTRAPRSCGSGAATRRAPLRRTTRSSTPPTTRSSWAGRASRRRGSCARPRVGTCGSRRPERRRSSTLRSAAATSRAIRRRTRRRAGRTTTRRSQKPTTRTPASRRRGEIVASRWPAASKGDHAGCRRRRPGLHPPRPPSWHLHPRTTTTMERSPTTCAS
mmetsp:Transcript_5291/g.21815  ORF Transcript_5291/g.21815 Transcript_5291/m.21815 type:complete len:251 (+) Transcript_5291:645-1397(+)